MIMSPIELSLESAQFKKESSHIRPPTKKGLGAETKGEDSSMSPVRIYSISRISLLRLHNRDARPGPARSWPRFESEKKPLSLLFLTSEKALLVPKTKI